MNKPPQSGLASASLTLRPTALDADGAGVAVHEDLLVHVARALPGETVNAHLVHVSQHRRTDGAHDAWAALDHIVHPSSDRVATFCPAYGACGGCVLQHLAPAAQIAWKRALVQQALPGIDVAPCVPSPKTLGYRNQAKYVVRHDQRRQLVLGAYAPRSHDIVDLSGCRLGEPPQDAIAAWLRDRLAAEGVQPFDERTRTGVLRYVVVRTNAAGAALVALVTARSAFAAGPAIAADLRAAFPAVVGVVQNVNESPGNVIFGSEERILAGAATIDETFAGVTVAIGARAFLQLNRDVARVAYTAIRAAIVEANEGRKVDRLVDVFSGVGSIAFSLADLAFEIIAIEANSAATAAGIHAAAVTQMNHVRFVTAEAATALNELDASDVVILNPPRAGAGAVVCAQLRRLRPRLLAYLSCDPATLARDLAALLQPAGDFVIEQVQPFDMLPHTTHVETLVVLRRADRSDVSRRFLHG